MNFVASQLVSLGLELTRPDRPTEMRSAEMSQYVPILLAGVQFILENRASLIEGLKSIRPGYRNMGHDLKICLGLDNKGNSYITTFETTTEDDQRIFDMLAEWEKRRLELRSRCDD